MKRVAALLSAMLLASCSFSLTVRLTNTGTEDLRLSQIYHDRVGDEILVKPGETRDFKVGSSRFILERHGRVKVYPFSDPGSTYYRYGGYFEPARLLPAEYGDDGCIYIGARAAVQPPGYPVCAPTAASAPPA